MRLPFTRSSIIFAAVISLLLISFADAFTLDMPGIQRHAALYNSRVESAPYVLTSILGSEIVNLAVTRDDGSVFRAGINVVDARIVHLMPGAYNNSTISITTTQSTLNQVVASKDKISEFKNMTDQGRISFTTDDWISDIKLKAALSSASVLQFGYNMFFG